jgi:hypothetical protein
MLHVGLTAARSRINLDIVEIGAQTAQVGPNLFERLGGEVPFFRVDREIDRVRSATKT